MLGTGLMGDMCPVQGTIMGTSVLYRYYDMSGTGKGTNYCS